MKNQTWQRLQEKKKHKKRYKDKEENLISAMNQLEIENMQLRRENNV